MEFNINHHLFYYTLRSVQGLIHVPSGQKDEMNKMLLELDKMYTDILNKNQMLICELNKLKNFTQKLEYDMNLLSIENKNLAKLLVENTKNEDLRPLSPPGLYPTLDTETISNNNNNNQNSSYSLFPNTFQSFIPEMPASFSENNTESILDVNDRIIEQKKDKEIINVDSQLDDITEIIPIQKNDSSVKQDIEESSEKKHEKSKKKVQEKNDDDKKWKKCKLFKEPINNIHKILTAVMHIFYVDYLKKGKVDIYFSKEIINHIYGVFFIDIIHNSKLNTTFLYLRDVKKKIGTNSYIRRFTIEYKHFIGKNQKPMTHFFYKE